MVVGIFYIVLFEFILANIDFAVRKLTVMYYFRVLVRHLPEVDRRTTRVWSIRLGDAPEPLTCVLVLLGVTVLATLLAARRFSSREFYVKTPEAN